MIREKLFKESLHGAFSLRLGSAQVEKVVHWAREGNIVQHVLLSKTTDKGRAWVYERQLRSIFSDRMATGQQHHLPITRLNGLTQRINARQSTPVQRLPSPLPHHIFNANLA